MDKVEVLINALNEIIELENTENDEWDAVERLIPEMVAIAKHALAKISP